MKKSLIALAVLGGLSGAAMAEQSFVTLYGVADAGVGKVNSTAQDALFTYVGLTHGAGPDSNNKTQFISGSRMNNGDSRIGVRGIENLGGGLRAGFNFESGVNLNDGSTTTPDGFWARQANMWLSGDWGDLRLGRQFTASYTLTSMYELTGAANYSVLGNTYNYVGLGQRTNSAIAYRTPTFNGFTFGGGFLSKNDTPATLNRNVVDVAGMYANGPFIGGVSVNKASGGKTGYQVGGRYSFSNFAVTASYTQAVIPGTSLFRRGFELGGTATFGAFAVTLDLTSDNKNQWANGKKYTNGVLELKYMLSKRTFVYAAYLRLDSTNNYGLGINHSF